MFELMDAHANSAEISVVGVGGRGGQAVEEMFLSGVAGVSFACVDTDAGDLDRLQVDLKVRIEDGDSLAVSLEGTPLLEIISRADMLFICSGWGAESGSRESVDLARLAKEAGVLTVALVSTQEVDDDGIHPSSADHEMHALWQLVDALITIPEKAPQSEPDDRQTANQLMFRSVKGIAELITTPGLINVDFADVHTVLAETGLARVGFGLCSGEDRAREAAEAAISSRHLEDVDLGEAMGMLVNVTAGMDLSIGEFQEVGAAVKEFVSDDATVVVGTVIDQNLHDQISVTIVATGLDAPKRNRMTASEQVRTKAGSSASPEEILDIPAFLRRQADNADSSDHRTSQGHVQIITPASVDVDFVARVVDALSDVYVSVGGDELILQLTHSESTQPPQSSQAEKKAS